MILFQSAPHVKLTPEEDAEFGTKEVLPPEPSVAFGPGSHMGPSSSTNSQGNAEESGSFNSNTGCLFFIYLLHVNTIIS